MPKTPKQRPKELMLKIEVASHDNAMLAGQPPWCVCPDAATGLEAREFLQRLHELVTAMEAVQHGVLIRRDEENPDTLTVRLIPDVIEVRHEILS